MSIPCIPSLRELLRDALADEGIRNALLGCASTADAMDYYHNAHGLDLQAGDVSLILAVLFATAHPTTPPITAALCCKLRIINGVVVCVIGDTENHVPTYDSTMIVRLKHDPAIPSTSVDNFRAVLSSLQTAFSDYGSGSTTQSSPTPPSDVLRQMLDHCFAPSSD